MILLPSKAGIKTTDMGGEGSGYVEIRKDGLKG